MQVSSTFAAQYSSPLGGILITGCADGISGLWFDGQKHYAAGFNAGDAVYVNRNDNEMIAMACEWLDRYFSGSVPDFIPPISLKGTVFRMKVWNALLRVEYGRTVSYRDIAEMIADGKAEPSTLCRAVGSAVGHNPVSLIVPCHRVIGADGSLAGYAGGIERKRRLLDLEGLARRNMLLPHYSQNE
ncbi:MAG: methylated-DNA--[protein]-cysteine S-methyltransferase [Candidatus Cryptobacteroides sp.]